MESEAVRALRALLTIVAPALTLEIDRPTRGEPIARVVGQSWALQRPIWDALTRMRRAAPGGGHNEVWRVWTERAQCPVCGVPTETWAPCGGCMLREGG